MACPEAPDEVSGGLIFFNMIDISIWYDSVFFDWSNIQSVYFGHFHVCFPVGTFTFTWISSLILVASPGYPTLSDSTLTQSPMMIIVYPFWNFVCYLIWWQRRWQWHVILIYSDSICFIHFHGGVSHFNDRSSAVSNMTIYNSWSLTINPILW